MLKKRKNCHMLFFKYGQYSKFMSAFTSFPHPTILTSFPSSVFKFMSKYVRNIGEIKNLKKC
jgi:hypothetical protein